MAKKGTALATTKTMNIEDASIRDNADRDELADAFEEDAEDLAELIRNGNKEEALELIGELQTALEIFTRYYNKD